MEKLLGLLNERNKELNPSAQVKWTELRVEINEWYLISKKCGFIKWLVKNDKINKGYKGLPAITKNGFLLEGETALLMILAIQDEPIDFLISILK